MLVIIIIFPSTPPAKPWRVPWDVESYLIKDISVVDKDVSDPLVVIVESPLSLNSLVDSSPPKRTESVVLIGWSEW